MQTRELGHTGIALGVIALGTEHLVEVPRETVASVVRQAVERGVNYVDVLFAYPDYQDNLGAAFEALRDRILIAGHLGSGEENGQYRRTRDLAESEELFGQLLSRLRTDRVDALFLSNCDDVEDFEQMLAPGGLLELAVRLRREGKARFIGLSGHQVPVALRAVESGQIDVLMHSINLPADADAEKRRLYHACAAAGVGLIGMKPFAGGSLLSEGARPAATAVQCLSYVLSQPGVCAALPGVKNPDELNAALAYLDAPDGAKDFSALVGHFRKDAEGQCVYCNHCLPCPAGIDVGKTIRLVDTARQAGAASLAAQYASLPAGASDCVECGDCVQRCPFSVDILAKMAQAVEIFDRGGAA